MALLSFWAPIERRRTRNATLARSTTTKGLLCGGIRHICIYGYLYATVWVILSYSRLVYAVRVRLRTYLTYAVDAFLEF